MKAKNIATRATFAKATRMELGKAAFTAFGLHFGDFCIHVLLGFR